MPRLQRTLLRAACALALVSCGPSFEPEPDRAASDRTPLTRACDGSDPSVCLMPWPNNAFTTADPSTETGVRLEVDLSSVSGRDDSAVLSRANGFSRVSSLVTGFPTVLEHETLNATSMRLVLAQHDHPDRLSEVALRYEVLEADDDRDGITTSAVVAHPLRPLVPGADYVAIITNDLVAADGTPLEATHETQVALGLATPETADEAAVAGYHAPTRALIAELGIDPTTVLRTWDFTTRSLNDPLKRLIAMRAAALAAVENGDTTVVIESVEHRDEGEVHSIVRGHLAGLPNYIVDRELSVDADGMPLAVGTRDAPFRVVIPRGTGDYRMLMFGHGTGGSVDDTAFDDSIASLGAAKVSIEFYHWTERTVVDTFLDLRTLVHGASIGASGLVQAMADAPAIRRAMSGAIGDALAAPMLMDEPNPHEGRRPDDSVPMWVGGSLGGTMGLVFAAANPDVRYAVLNVAGAGWATWVRDAYQYSLLQVFIERGNGGHLAVAMMVAAAQTLLDEADGANWVEALDAEPLVALVQESVGDPVLPNPGTHMVAEILDATQVGAPLIELDGLTQADSVVGASGLTQFHVPSDDPLKVHGFADRDGAPGDAARAQILTFVQSAWAGEAHVEIPEGCPDGSCDFTR